jgi:hypothetical protein
MKRYAAPWSSSLIFTTWGMSFFCLCVSVLLMWQVPGLPVWISPLPLGVVVLSALFSIRHYALDSEGLHVRRPLWTTRLPLTGLKSARVEPEAMTRSLRLFGNGGLFSFTGYFRNKALGTYRAFVTDPKRSVVLRFQDRTIIVSPDAPEDFVSDLEARGAIQIF